MAKRDRVVAWCAKDSREFFDAIQAFIRDFTALPHSLPILLRRRTTGFDLDKSDGNSYLVPMFSIMWSSIADEAMKGEVLISVVVREQAVQSDPFYSGKTKKVFHVRVTRTTKKDTFNITWAGARDEEIPVATSLPVVLGYGPSPSTSITPVKKEPEKRDSEVYVCKLLLGADGIAVGRMLYNFYMLSSSDQKSLIDVIAWAQDTTGKLTIDRVYNYELERICKTMSGWNEEVDQALEWAITEVTNRVSISSEASIYKARNAKTTVITLEEIVKRARDKAAAQGQPPMDWTDSEAVEDLLLGAQSDLLGEAWKAEGAHNVQTPPYMDLELLAARKVSMNKANAKAAEVMPCAS